MQSLAFDTLTDLYDETRTVDPACFDAALDWVVQRFPPEAFGNVCEPGIGNGRIALPLAERGYRVTGADLSPEMLALLAKRVDGGVRACRADVCRLPFPDGAFDAAIALHLFYFVREWQAAAREMLRLVRAGGPILLMHTGTGAEVPALNERYKALCAARRCAIEPVGVTSTREVADFLAAQGCHVEWVRDRWRWTERIRLDAALGHLEARAYSFTTIAPDEVHAAAVGQLADELRQEHGSLEMWIEIPKQVYTIVAKKD